MLSGEYDVNLCKPMGSSSPRVYLLIHFTSMAVLLRQYRFIYEVYPLLVHILLTHDDAI